MQQQRKIIHIDMDCFYAAIEVRDKPELRGRPVAVGGQPNSRGVLCTCNYEARKYGIHSAMPSARAARQCPELIILPVNFDKYRQASRAIHKIFHKYTELVEPLSLDEAYLDVSHSPLYSGSATLIAQQIRRDIFKSQKITASAGIAPNKMLAKIASDWQKPNGQYVITPDKVSEFIVDLPVKKLSGVGKVTAEKLHKHNISTCGDIQKYSLTELMALFGRWGEHLHKMAQGIDDRDVVTEWERKSLSVESTFPQDYLSNDISETILNDLFDELKTRLEKSDKQAADIKTLFIKIKFSDFSSTTSQTPIQQFSISAFKALLHTKIQNEQRPVRLLGFGVYFKNDEIKQIERQLTLGF